MEKGRPAGQDGMSGRGMKGAGMRSGGMRGGNMRGAGRPGNANMKMDFDSKIVWFSVTLSE